MLATVLSASLFGVTGRAVTVEVHLSSGLPSFAIVGQPDGSCREARDRVRAALISSGFAWPQNRVTVNLAPTTLKKVGSALDLAIAVGVLIAQETIPARAVERVGFLGELGLDGSLHPVSGALALVAELPGETAVVPVGNLDEARLIARHEPHPVTHLTEVVAALSGDEPWPEPRLVTDAEPEPALEDLADVVGNQLGRRALEVAAAGGHHLLMIGPPGAGKTMLARRLPGLLPPLGAEAAIEATTVHSASGERLPPGGLITRPPFRSPHHTATAIALVGGGTAFMRPGEISKAHGGVLFLDELGEFPAMALDALRQPLEEGMIRVSRAVGTATFPARFLLIAAMNPCPCGAGQGPASCRCTDGARARYARRISGPILDRFDLRIDVPKPDAAQLLDDVRGEPSSAVRERVLTVRQRAEERQVSTNARLAAPQLADVAPLSDEAADLLRRTLHRGGLSARGLQRVRCVARTIADLRGGGELLEACDVREALVLRTNPACFDQQPVLL